jgi:hypothetical protein
VVLALPNPGADDALPVYDPASGRDVRVSRDSWRQARLGLSSWDRPWFLVLPAGLSPAARRTPA